MAAEDIHSFAAAYALHALDPGDEQRFEAHLAGCDRCRVDVAGYLESATALAAAVEPADPPAELRDRILTQARAERPNVVPLRPRRFASPTAITSAIAAVAACAAIGLGIWANSLQDSLNRERAAAPRVIQVSGASATLAVTRSGQAALIANDLGQAPDGKTYEVWVIEGKVPKRAGVFDGGK